MRLMIFAIVGISMCLAVSAARVGSVNVDDAYVRGTDDGRTWTIGTGALEMGLAWRDGAFRLISFKNKLAHTAREYVDLRFAAPPFLLDSTSDASRFTIDTVWKRYLPDGQTADPGVDGICISVRKGEMIGFSVGPHGDFRSDQTEWPMTVDYGDGDSYTSLQDTGLNQGPIWYYYLHTPGTGILIPVDSIEYVDNAKENVRIPSITSPFRSYVAVPHIGTTMLHPSNEQDAVRVWCAPKDGIVSVHGTARHLRGQGDIDLSVLHIRHQLINAKPHAESEWSFISAEGRKVETGGRPAVQLDVRLMRESLNVIYHLLAFPRTNIVRQWVDVTNTGTSEARLNSPSPLSFVLRSDGVDSFTHHWMIGGNSLQDEGMLHSSPVTKPYHWQIFGHKTDNYTPWTSLQRNDGQHDGWFFVQEYIGNWRFSVDKDATGPIRVSSSVSPGSRPKLLVDETVQLPMITIGVYRDSLEDMGERVYNWQYEYMWDYTHDDWYGRMLLEPPWPNDIRNLQENFTMRLANQDLKTIDDMRTTGMELLWDDAGWSENPNVWEPSREGPDFLNTQRYIAKSGMKWLLWFCGEPTSGMMDTKVGSWGDFQWRTDGQPDFTFEMDTEWRQKVTRFLKIHPRSSFHTTSGGSRYSHSFEPQRYADINMFTDPGGGDQTNYYLSYLETPDKWMDIIPPLMTRGKYMPDTSRQLLTMIPAWPRWAATNDDLEQLRRMCDIYHFMMKEGVAGRWVYMLHPTVKGDLETYYAQRISYDRTKSLIVLKHRAPGKITIYPKGLLSEHEYVLGFDSTQATTRRTGLDLMKNGVTIEKQSPGELIYIGLPNRPGSGTDKVPPKPPSNVMIRRENNIGHEGIGVYWSPGSDNNRISYYEVRRNGNVLGKVSYGTNFFDYFTGWDPKAEYAVRTVDSDCNTSGWTSAKRIADEPITVSALGGHFAERGREGWNSETTTDNKTYTPMTFIPPAKEPWGDAAGTGNQAGGVEGYWEGSDTARTGRGWQQASMIARCTRTWTAPQDGHIRITGRVMKEYYRRAQGGPLQVCILHNDRQIWPSDGWAIITAGDIQGISHDINLDVVHGDTIRFLLDKGASQDSDIICWMPRIVYTETGSIDLHASIVRILCGSPNPYVDSSRNNWSADTFFSGGKPISTTSAIDVPPYMLSDQSLYKLGRQGKDFTYSIPVKPGLYTVRLKFAEPKYRWFFQRPFNLTINGRQVMNNTDICQSARSWRRAHDRIFRYIVPDDKGCIVLRFTGGFDPLQKSHEAMVQAIEILPEIKPAVRIDVGSETRYIDWNSFVWDADLNSQGTHIITSDKPVSQASPTLHDQGLYQTARAGKELTYSVTVVPGLYTVHLKFAELWLLEPGLRPMNIEVNGCLVWRDWDPAAAADQLGMAADIRVDDVTPDKDGHITIRVKSTGQHEAILQGIEIE